jgi:hypothetical protein
VDRWAASQFRDSFQILPRTGAAKATSSRRPFCLSANPTLAPFLRQSHLGLACRRNTLPTPLCCPCPPRPAFDVARQPITLPLASGTTAVSRRTDRPTRPFAPPAGLIARCCCCCCSCSATPLTLVIKRLSATSHTPPRLVHSAQPLRSDQSRWLPNRPSRLLLGNVDGAPRPQSSRRTSASTSPSLQTHAIASGPLEPLRAAPEATSSPPSPALQALTCRGPLRRAQAAGRAQA